LFCYAIASGLAVELGTDEVRAIVMGEFE